MAATIRSLSTRMLVDGEPKNTAKWLASTVLSKKYSCLRFKKEGNMLSAVTGTYRNGKVDLKERPLGVEDGAEVVVTFLPPSSEEASGPLPSLRGAWAGKVPENYDLDAVLHEVRGEWEKEWEGEEIV